MSSNILPPRKLIDQVVEFKKNINRFDKDSERRQYIKSFINSGNDLNSIISILLFGPHPVRNKKIGFFILNNAANTDLLQLELAWCCINGHATTVNYQRGIQILFRLDNVVKNCPPKELFKTDITGISWEESGLADALEKSGLSEKLNRQQQEIRKKERLFEFQWQQIKKKRKREKENLLKIRRWRKKNFRKCLFLEYLLPIGFYIIITGLLDLFVIMLKDSVNIFPFITILLFEICLIISYFNGRKPKDINQKYKFSKVIFYLPFYNLFFLFWFLLTNSGVFFSIFMIIASLMTIVIGGNKASKRSLNRDVEFFKKVIYPHLKEPSNWTDLNTLSNTHECIDYQKKFPHLPKRFKSYRLIRQQGDGLWDQSGTFFAGVRIDKF